MLQLSLWVADTRLGDLDPEISSVAEGPLSLLRSTLEASAGSITHPNPTDPHLTPLLNTSLYATAHLWVSEGRVSPSFRELNGPPMLRRCLGVMAAVAEGEQAGRRTDAPPRSARGLWGSLDSSVGPPSVALDVLSALHTLIGDEHVISKGAGEPGLNQGDLCVSLVPMRCSQGHPPVTHPQLRSGMVGCCVHEMLHRMCVQ